MKKSYRNFSQPSEITENFVILELKSVTYNWKFCFIFVILRLYEKLITSRNLKESYVNFSQSSQITEIFVIL